MFKTNYSNPIKDHKCTRIFILEDDPHRIQKFKDRFNGSEVPDGTTVVWSAADTVPEAQRLLSNVTYDWVFLDHDLVDVNSGLILEATMQPQNGGDLAKWLAENPEIASKHGKYVTHSLNKPGRDRIVGFLRSIGIACEEAPFLWEETIFNKYVTWPDPE